MLQEYVNYEMEKVETEKDSSMSMNLKSVGGRIGQKAMLKLASSVTVSKTKDVQACVKFFMDVFWEFVFGKRIERVQVMESNKAVFTDSDFELMSRASKHGQEAKVFQEHCKNLVRCMIEGCLSVLSVKCTVDICPTEGKAIQFTIECSESYY